MWQYTKQKWSTHEIAFYCTSQKSHLWDKWTAYAKGSCCKVFFSDFSKQLQVVKSNYVKKLLVGDFAETTGFYNRFEKTRLLWSLTHNKLEVLLKLQLNHVECCRKVQNLPDMPWPPTIDEASDNNECINLLTKFLSWIKISSLKNQSCHHR